MTVTRNHSPPKLLRIQHLRAVAALIVVIYHLPKDPILNPWSKIGSFGIDLFFVISGFVIVYTTHPKWGISKEAIPFLLKRIARICPVYWEFTLFMLLLFGIMPHALNTPIPDINQVIFSFLLLPQNAEPVLPVGWSLVYEMYYYLLFSLLFFIPRKFFLTFLGGLMIFTLGLHFILLPEIGYVEESPFVRLIQSPNTLDFIFGAFIGWLHIRKKGRGNTLWFLTGVCLFIAGTIYMVVTDTGDLLIRALICGGSSALIVHNINSPKSLHYRFISSTFAKIGDASYSLYISHGTVMGIMNRLWLKMESPNSLIHIFWLLIIVISATSFAIIHYQYIENPIRIFFKKRIIRQRPAL